MDKGNTFSIGPQMRTQYEQPPMKPHLEPPFSAASSVMSQMKIVLPAMVQDTRVGQCVFPKCDMGRFLAVELLTPKLDRLHDSLWLAGLPLPPRPLQRQATMGRVLHVTERPDEHLVWHQTRLLLKPLPDYLLCHEFWADHLCADAALHRSATGFLLSYIWLVEHQSDFALAQRSGLVPAGIDWARWTGFAQDFVSHIRLYSLDQVDRRYLYGELRLSRLNSMTRFLPSMWSRDNLVRGYMSTSTWYQAFFESSFSWLLAVFAFFSMLLSAMQVGLSTQRLDGNRQFENLSYGVTMLAIATIFLGLGLLWFVWGFLFCYHLFSTRHLNKGVQKTRSNKFEE